MRVTMIGLGFAGAGSASATILIATPSTITATFAAAKGGDLVKMVGTFGFIGLRDLSFTTTLKIDASQATFTDSFSMFSVSNVLVTGGHFDVTGGSRYNKAAAIFHGSKITFEDPTVVGVASQSGIVFEGTTNAEVSDGSFDGLHVAVGFNSVTNGYASRNTIIHADSDGIDIGDSHNVTASHNSCALGNPGAGVHPDCIQIWSLSGNPVSTNIVVTRNTASGQTQGFTLFGSGGGGKNISITHNTVTTSLPQGVACYSCYDSTISYNTLTTLRGSAHLTNLNIIGGGRNHVFGNQINPYPDVENSLEGADTVARFATRFAGEAAADLPEPGPWAMMVIGFGVVGACLRRRLPAVV